MAIAQSVFDIAFGEASKHGAAKIRKIKLSIGEFSGAVKDSLDFAFEVLKKDTPASNAEIEIEVIKLKAVCGECGEVECRLGDLKLSCQICGCELNIIAGRDMTVDYIDLDEGE
ncbi:MAG TPA: hydrogenase maturation nickel metallochaperone HypA [Pyrinomonadaceae bacterium]|nr:hydrogenase maturation nickel metallochaperone HypA [Acidobacteriota bacterium]HQZ96851.1 hydrogenase maturation nickel metallochaperone HypA [Pyrinomonadaceae bacterium]